MYYLSIFIPLVLFFTLTIGLLDIHSHFILLPYLPSMMTLSSQFTVWICIETPSNFK
jgi:hypothetical protein